jgi:hypothetical protein
VRSVWYIPIWQLTVGPVQISADERRVLFRDIAHWAANAGRYSVEFLAVRYEDHLHRHLNASVMSGVFSLQRTSIANQVWFIRSARKEGHLMVRCE